MAVFFQVLDVIEKGAFIIQQSFLTVRCFAMIRYQCGRLVLFTVSNHLDEIV